MYAKEHAETAHMTSFLFVIVACLILCFGHIGWGLIHPFRALREQPIDPVVPASLHGCWYHISIIFFATAALSAWHLAIAPVPTNLLALLGVLLFCCWLSYLITQLFFPQFWRIAWFQMALIPAMLASLAYGIVSMAPAA